MSSTRSLCIDAVVDDGERPALVAASEQLGECLRAASGGPWPVEISFRDCVAAIDAGSPPPLVVLSMLPELTRPAESRQTTEARWRESLQSLAQAAIPAVFICTVFRHVARPAVERGPPPVVERIRRLNLLAVELSHDTGAGVIDIDRVFAHLGARMLGTDHRLAGSVAAEVAAHTIVSTMLAFGIDEVIPPEIQQRAQKYQGGLREIGTLVNRRLARVR